MHVNEELLKVEEFIIEEEEKKEFNDDSVWLILFSLKKFNSRV